MRALLTAFGLALILSATPSVALADGGDDEDTNADTPDSNDPGIAALHEAIQDRHDFAVALRTECPNNGDAKCREAFKAIRDSFKEARQKAIEQHHAYKQEQKKARDEAKAKGKDKAEAAKDKASEKRDEARAKNSASSKPAESPKANSTPKPSESPRP